MKTSKILISLIILSIIATALVYPALPKVIPIHWNINGQADGFAGKAFTFFTACLPLITYLLMLLFPKIDPRRDSYARHEKAYTITCWSLALFFIAIHWLTVLVALGHKMDITFFIRIFLGVFFIVLGNYVTQARQNYSFGMRTPWALADERVWKKTNRLGGYGFVLTGIVSLLSLFFRGAVAFGIVIGSIGVVSLYTYVYSYLEYRKLGLKK